MIREGAEIDRKDECSNTALHFACILEGKDAAEGKDTEVLTNIAVFLVLSRADVNIKNLESCTALHYCSKKLAVRLSSLVEIRDSDINFLIKKAVDYK